MIGERKIRPARTLQTPVGEVPLCRLARQPMGSSAASACLALVESQSGDFFLRALLTKVIIQLESNPRLI